MAGTVPDKDRHVETVKAHIEFPLDNLKTYDAVKEGVAEGWLGLHGWIYYLEASMIISKPA